MSGRFTKSLHDSMWRRAFYQNALDTGEQILINPTYWDEEDQEPTVLEARPLTKDEIRGRINMLNNLINLNLYWLNKIKAKKQNKVKKV